MTPVKSTLEEEEEAQEARLIPFGAPTHKSCRRVTKHGASTKPPAGGFPDIPEQMESSKAASNSLAGDGSPNIDYTNVARVLPRDIIAKFLAEGAANIIYRIVPKAPSQNHEHIEEHLGQSPVGAKQWPYQLSADIGDCK